MAPTPVSLPGKSRGQKSPAGYSPRGHKELDMTEVTEHARAVGAGIVGEVTMAEGARLRLRRCWVVRRYAGRMTGKT